MKKKSPPTYVHIYTYIHIMYIPTVQFYNDWNEGNEVVEQSVERAINEKRI